MANDGEQKAPIQIDHYLMRFFSYGHLPENLQAVSRPYAQLAKVLDAMLHDNPEKTVALRKLLESKDCAVRAAIY